MKQRCHNPKSHAFKDYGARGITVCKGLQVSSELFFKLLGPKPSPEYTLDRPDNNGGYWCGECEECFENTHPKNIRWADASTQLTNRRGWSWKGRIRMATKSIRGGTLTAQANGRKLMQLRVAKGLKQRDVETEVGIPHGQLTRFETGKPVGIKYLLRLAAYYGQHPKDLLSPEGISTTSDLLTDLAKLHGVKVDFGTNGEHSELDVDDGEKHRMSMDMSQTFTQDQNSQCDSLLVVT